MGFRPLKTLTIAQDYGEGSEAIHAASLFINLQGLVPSNLKDADGNLDL